MNTLRSFLILIIVSHSVWSSAQNVDCRRSAALSPSATYNTEGTAYLERFDNGEIKLRLGADFKADIGPDVQIFLSNDSTSVAGGVMIADIGQTDGLNHFSGEIVFSVPAAVNIDTYGFIVLRCVTFSAYWGGGRFSITCTENPPNPMDTTMTNTPMC